MCITAQFMLINVSFFLWETINILGCSHHCCPVVCTMIYAHCLFSEWMNEAGKIFYCFQNVEPQ
jgi:hypothetical protein